MTLYLDKGRVTDAEAWRGESPDNAHVQNGDPEWRLLDDPDNPSGSFDFLLRDEALDYAKAIGEDVVEIWNKEG